MKLIVLSIGVVALAMAAVAQQDSSSDHFHWDLHNWQELSWKQSISRLRLPPALKADLIGTIVEQMREDDDGRPQKELRQIAAETRIAFVDLTGRGRNEVVAQAGGDKSDCSPTGNCPLWVLRPEHDGYDVILDADSEQTFTIQPTRTNGFSDLVLGMHGSAFESELRLYKFDGSRYKQAGCFEASWQLIDDRGEAQHLHEPRVTPCE